MKASAMRQGAQGAAAAGRRRAKGALGVVAAVSGRPQRRTQPQPAEHQDRTAEMQPRLQQPLPGLDQGGGLPAAGAAPQRLQLHYKSTWQQPILHHSVAGGTWQGLPMHRVVSGGGWWRAADLRLDAAAVAAASSNGSTPLLEFVITDGQDGWDKQQDGGNYAISAPGNWQLRDGTLQPAAAPAVLLVSDLDDTMIGDDEATAAFAAWWREEACPNGGRLVYNTGRALDLFEALLQEKAHVLPEPDMLISAIGTRIYVKRDGRWEEDEEYTALLGRGWHLEGVREACYKALARVGKEAMHFRPPSEMSEHKVTCGVRLDVLDTVLSSIKADLADARYRLVVSGSGDWRFVDLVPAEAGKLQALEYARRTLGFLPEQTVACGDSGNDIDMLEGHHLSIVVGNAHRELVEWAKTQRNEAAGELLLVHGHRAHGILEGLQRFGFKL